MLSNGMRVLVLSLAVSKGIDKASPAITGRGAGFRTYAFAPVPLRASEIGNEVSFHSHPLLSTFATVG